MPTPVPWTLGRDGLTLCSQYRGGRRELVATFQDPADAELARKAVNVYADRKLCLKGLCDAIAEAKIPFNKYPRLARAYRIARGALEE